MNIKPLIIFIFSLIFTTAADIIAQEQDTSGIFGENPASTFDFSELKSKKFGVDQLGKPTIGFDYGFVKSSLKNLNEGLSNAGSIELKIGYTTQNNFKKSESIIQYMFDYLAVSNLNYNLNKTASGTSLKTDIWRFNLGWDNGFGYRIGSKSAVVLYNGGGFGWSQLDMNNTVSDSTDKKLIAVFGNIFRFGSKAEGGVKIEFIPQLSMDASYERFAIFPRHLFWQFLGSFGIEVVAQELLNEFVKQIMTSSPEAGPIAGFILKNALSYGVYELRKNKMNFPFNSVPALLTDCFKVGLTFTF
jgi:opacity protein-like surface antigen